MKLVALRKESVDRNFLGRQTKREHLQSLSARRAWIEIDRGRNPVPYFGVALRKESVDRNVQVANAPQRVVVALRKESVDRNILQPM